MLVTLIGTLISVMLVQPEKALSAILVTLDGIVMFVKLSHHCQRGTANTTLQLSMMMGLLIGMMIGECVENSLIIIVVILAVSLLALWLITWPYFKRNRVRK